MAKYTREPINGFTHLFGAILSFAGLLILVIKKWKKYKKSVDVYLKRWYIITCPWERGKNLKS